MGVRKVTFSIPTFNSEKYLDSCLRSIFNQDYPKEKIEIIIADGGSSDNTIEIAKKYNVDILHNEQRKAEIGTKLAAQAATGDLFVVFAADNELKLNNWLLMINEFFNRYQDLAAVWGRMIASKGDPAIIRYYELIQSEPLAYFLNKNLQYYTKRTKAIKLNDLTYYYFNVQHRRPLCWGANGLVYKLDYVRDVFKREGFIGDNEIFQYMVEKGCNKVIYSPSLNHYHHTVNSIFQWVQKWKRNFVEIFLETRHARRIDWFYYGHFKLKLFFWLIYSLFPIFSLAHAVFLAVRNRNFYWLYHPLMSFLQAATYAFWVLRLSKGRQWAKEQFLS